MIRTACFAALALVLARSIAAEPSASSSPGASAPASAARELISVEDFGALPFMTNPKISPDGTRVIATAYIDGRRFLTMFPLAPNTPGARSFAMPENRDLVWFRWAGDNRILISIGQADSLFGEDVYVTRLLSYDLTTGKPSFVGKRTQGLEGDNVIHVDRDGRWLLLNVQRSIYDYPTVWRVDLDTLEMEKVVGEHPHVWDWFADSRGTVRAGLGMDGRRWWVLYRKSADARFEKVMRRTVSDEEIDSGIERFVPLDGSDRGYAVANARTGRYGLYQYDFTTDSVGEPIFEHPQVDIDDIRMSEQGALEAVYYTDDRSRIEWLDPQMKSLQAEIDAALPGRINRVVSASRDGKRMIVWTGSASDPGAYYLFQVSAGAMSMLSRPYERLKGKQLATMASTSYRARDGLEIPAYLTEPRGVEPKLLPLIVMPHGGPFSRDAWGYDPWVQFLANRGYIVLQPNFRGSTGYGKAFVDKGIGQWGRTMQDDLDDGVKWLVEQGKVDPKRVCIMGASYGGYAAMWAAARNPDIYRCAISFAGISDLSAMMRYDRKSFAAPRYYRAWRSKVQGDKEFDLNSVSPLNSIERIGIPLLIAHGDRDENVPLTQSRKLHEALQKASKPHSYVVFQGEGHGFEQPKNATEFLRRVDDFLRTHNPAN